MIINTEFDKEQEYLSKEELEEIKKIKINGIPKESIKMVNDVFTRSRKDWIQTFSGERFYPLTPDINTINIIDIAHALSMQCRFSGHTKFHYSVAQHCVYVSYLCNIEDAFYGLLHDASEAYLVDVPKPLKDSGKFLEYKILEKNLQNMIYQKYIGGEEPGSVHKADMICLATEATQLYNNLRDDWVLPTNPSPFIIEEMSPGKAKQLFIDRFNELNGK
jgi:hypothetical protein